MARKPMRQPGIPYVEAAIGDFDLMPIPPEHFQSLTHTRTALDSANDVEITVYDRTAIEISAQLAFAMRETGLPKLKFKYGWYREPERDSPEFECIVTDWNLTFDQTGAIIDISGVSNIVAARSNNEAMEFPGKPIHEIVEYMAEEMGYTPIVDKTANRYKQQNAILYQKVVDEEGYIVTKKSTEDAMDFIHRLAKIAVARKEDILDPLANNFRVYVDDSEKILYFKHIGDYRKPEPDHLYVFEWNKENSDVISWNPSSVEFLLGITSMSPAEKRMAGVEGIERAASFPESLYPDPDTGLMNAIRAADEPVDSEIERSSYSAHTQNHYIKTLDTSSSRKEWMQARMNNLSSVASHLRYEANAEIIGDGSIKPHFADNSETLEFHIYLPDGTMHFTSGIYQVMEVVDEISEGQFTTNLTMIRESVTEQQEEINRRLYGLEETDEKAGLVYWERKPEEIPKLH